MPDPHDFREFVEAYQQKVFRLVSSILGPSLSAEAEDVTQEVFLQAYRRFTDFRGDAQVGTWLYSIARNKALDHRKRARFRLPHLTLDPVPLSAPPSGVDDRMMLAQCMGALPETYRTLLYLHYWQGATVEEISEYTGLVPGTVKSYLARARGRVEEQLAKRGVHSL